MRHPTWNIHNGGLQLTRTGNFCDSFPSSTGLQLPVSAIPCVQMDTKSGKTIKMKGKSMSTLLDISCRSKSEMRVRRMFKLSIKIVWCSSAVNFLSCPQTIYNLWNILSHYSDYTWVRIINWIHLTLNRLFTSNYTVHKYALLFHITPAWFLAGCHHILLGFRLW
jgi:hypothetical protein